MEEYTGRSLTYEDQAVKILLVDDREENLIAMRKTLAPLKLEIITAISGNDALKLLLKQDFAVVLLDVMMPDINGFEVAALMHANDLTKYIPIIFITAINKSEQNYIQAMEAGAIDYLYKPIDPLVLLTKVKVFVDLYVIRQRLEKTIVKMNEFQTQLQEYNIKLKQLAEEDILTKTSNRRHFEDEIVGLLAQSQESGQNIILFFIDVDNFKNINDTYGHRTGDLVLRILADRMKQLSDMPEITSDGINLDIIARVGGDEFAIVAHRLNDLVQNVEIIAQYILKLTNAPFECDGSKIKVCISIGVAIYPHAGNTLTDLMRCADIALYQSKAAGKNTFRIYGAV